MNEYYIIYKYHFWRFLAKVKDGIGYDYGSIINGKFVGEKYSTGKGWPIEKVKDYITEKYNTKEELLISHPELI